MHFSRSTAAALVALLPAYTLAQTFTECDATQEDCEPEVGLPSSQFTSDFTQGESAGASWSEAEGTSLTYGNDGAEYIIERERQAPTVGSDFTIFYGRVEVVMKAAHGTGIVSSIVLESDVLDEIDWEFLGSKPTEVQTNYYGLANTTTYDRVGYHQIPDATADFHTYTIDWSPERIEFIIDGNNVRTVNRADTEGRNYPQTPMQVKLGNWAAGGPGLPEGTVQWAGGRTNFDDGPFVMTVRSIDITNYNPACAYSYGDRSGSDDSINIITSGELCKDGEVANPSSSSAAASSTTASSTASRTSAAASTFVSTAAESATVAPQSSQVVAPIVPTAYINTTALASATTYSASSAPTVSSNATTATGAPSTEETEGPSYDGGAALNGVATAMSLLAIAAGLWAM